VTQTIIADALTSTQTITPSPVTVTSQTTTYTTAVATATTVVTDTRTFEFHLAAGPADACVYDPSEYNAIESGDDYNDGSCAIDCASEYFSYLDFSWPFTTVHLLKI
jgi:hypothetical protein